MAKTRPTPPPLPPIQPVESEDVFLRRWGFVILARPKDGPARWRRGRIVYLHADALAAARRELADLNRRLREANG